MGKKVSRVKTTDELVQEKRLTRAQNAIKILKIYEIVRYHSNNQRAIGTKEILQRLADDGIKCKRATLYEYLDYLEAMGYIERAANIDRQKAYFFHDDNRQISYANARFLIDTTQSAAFLTKSQTSNIVGDLLELVGEQKGNQLKSDVITFTEIKHDNEEIFHSIVAIDAAISQKKKITFVYNPLRFNENSTKVETCNPISLVFTQGYYYVCCCYDNSERIYSFRLDRMTRVELGAPTSITDQQLQKLKNDKLLHCLTSFGMWIGDLETITLRARKQHQGDIVDKFGLDVRSKCYAEKDKDGKDEWFRVTVTTHVSDVFLGWCASYGNELEIVSPPSVRQALRQRLQTALSLYE